MRLPTTQLQAICPPVVNGALVVLPVRAQGELHGLVASAELWREVVAALAPLVGGAPIASRQGRKPDAALRARYDAITAEAARTGRTLAAVCRAHGLRPSTLWGWRYYEAKRAAARKPITKPNGRLL